MRPSRFAARRALFHPHANAMPTTATRIGHQMPIQSTGAMLRTATGTAHRFLPVSLSNNHNASRIQRGKCRSEW